MRLSCIVLFLGWLVKQWTLAREQYLKPSILVSPSQEIFLGEQFSIYCRRPYANTKIFQLQKEGNRQPWNMQATRWNEGIFTISNAQNIHVGKYWCWYCFTDSECSAVSDVLYLNITGRYPKASISVSPNHEIFLGEQFSINCRSPYVNTKIFQLQKEGNEQVWIMQATQSNEGIFTISNAQNIHVGKYWCWYCFGGSRCSQISDVLYLKITEVAYRKPSISVHPSEVVTLGESVSVHCKNEGLQTANFTLQIYNSLKTDKTIETKTGGSEFLITKVEYTDAGIYQCRYCSQSESAFYQRCSNYSEQVYINVTGYWTPKPFIQLTPSEEISPGSNVTIECQGPYNDWTFLLLKSNQVTASKKTRGGQNSTKFHLSRVTSEDVGNYTCHYYYVNEFIWSVPSDPVELLLRGESKIPISIWASIAAGLLLLVLLLLLIAFALHRKRKKRSTVKRSAQPMSMVTDFPPTEPDTKTEPDEVSYAVLNHNSLKTKRAVDNGQVSESCTYATVA